MTICSLSEFVYTFMIGCLSLTRKHFWLSVQKSTYTCVLSLACMHIYMHIHILFHVCSVHLMKSISADPKYLQCINTLSAELGASRSWSRLKVKMMIRGRTGTGLLINCMEDGILTLPMVPKLSTHHEWYLPTSREMGLKKEACEQAIARATKVCQTACLYKAPKRKQQAD